MGATSGHPTAQPYSRAGLLAKLTGAATLAVGSFLVGQGTSQLTSTGSGLTWASNVLTATSLATTGGSAPATQSATASQISAGVGRFGTQVRCDGTGAASIQTAGGITMAGALTGATTLSVTNGYTITRAGHDTIGSGPYAQFGNTGTFAALQTTASGHLGVWTWSGSAWTQTALFINGGGFSSNGYILSTSNATAAVTGSNQAVFTGVNFIGRRGTGEYIIQLESADGASNVNFRRIDADNALEFRAGSTVMAHYSATGCVLGAASLIGSERVLVSGGGALPSVSATQIALSAGGGAFGAGISCTSLTASADSSATGMTLSGATGLLITRAAATIRGIKWQTAGVDRWRFVTDTAAEGGANAGCSLQLIARADDGSAIDTPLSFSRAAGTAINIGRPLTLTSTSASAIDCAGSITVASGKGYRVNGVQVLGGQGAAVADASGGSVIDVEARAALNALLARMRGHGSIAT